MDDDARKQLLQAINRMQMARQFAEQASNAVEHSGLDAFVGEATWMMAQNDLRCSLRHIDKAMQEGHTLWQASHDAER